MATTAANPVLVAIGNGIPRNCRFDRDRGATERTMPHTAIFIINGTDPRLDFSQTPQAPFDLKNNVLKNDVDR
jgi:hypothetical protein